ncbi:MAG: metallophosphoesterase family protein, partial [Candidatus Thorarchaeota archaeon]
DERVGCEAQRRWIEENQPKLVVCGHIHGGYGLGLIGNTLVVNASICNEKYQPVNRPVVLEI